MRLLGNLNIDLLWETLMIMGGLAAIICGFLGVYVARRVGLNAVFGFFVGLFFNIIGLLALILLGFVMKR